MKLFTMGSLKARSNCKVDTHWEGPFKLFSVAKTFGKPPWPYGLRANFVANSLPSGPSFGKLFATRFGSDGKALPTKFGSEIQTSVIICVLSKFPTSCFKYVSKNRCDFASISDGSCSMLLGFTPKLGSQAWAKLIPKSETWMFQDDMRRVSQPVGK